MEFLVLWSGITHSVLGAHVISTCYIKKIVNCKAVWQSPPKCCKAHFNISIWKMPYINAIPLPLQITKGFWEKRKKGLS